MGGGASTVGELTVEQKAEISREIQARYAQTAMSSDTATISDIEVYKTLADVYQAEIDKFKSITSSSESGNAKDVNLGLDEMLDGPVVLVRSDTDLSTKSNRSNSGGVAIDQHIDHDFDHEDPMVRAKTSQDLLSECQEAHDQNAKISSFINQLKDGDISTTRTSRFRIRRLTYSQRTLEVSESASPISKQQARRTTIYASTEIGVRQEKVPPFPDNYLGTFSCHGIEPSDDDEGVHDKINQDRGCVVYPYNSSMETALFMALDGHGEQGDAVSEFVMKQIVVSLEKHPGLLDDPVLALTETFVKTNIALMATNISYMTSGCTCVCAYVVGEKLYVANCGDSRAVMAVGSSFSNLKAKNLSRDHKPDDPEEAKRITEWGGYILPAPEPGLTARVYLDPQFTMIGLAMARSLGDFAVKNVGVIAEPEVLQFNLTSEDQFMILASDGVWEFIYSQEAVDIVAKSLKEGMNVTEACQELIQQAAQRWAEEEGDYRDDITAVVIRFPWPHQGTLLDPVAN